ncbi:MAG: VPLPA-CTERM sorting domain-containing protein [Gammaproteobacteria bacterium]|nr:VPLPA-CTERM sorting domain-containing protein [Gammaproteobacteria bacterium]
MGTTRKTLLGLSLLGACGVANASLVYGTLSNFDVYNDTGGRTYGFEIELEDISIGDIRYTFNNPHYGQGEKIQRGTIAVLRYAASFDSNSSLWSAFTEEHPVGGAVATTGHACVFATGCEHYGLGLYAQPSATRYHWLVEDPLNPGSTTVGPAVDLMAPVWSFAPAQNPAAPPRVAVRVDAPEFEVENENEKHYPDAVWARITKIELEDEVLLDALMSDNADLFDNPNIPVEQETEWELIEKGANPLEKADDPADGVEQIIRRIETFRYIGPVTAENEPDCDQIDCDNPVPDVTLGDLIGANIVAANLQPVQVVPVPAAAWLFVTALGGLIGLHRARRSA